jgi:hypothetical protein
VITVAQWSNEDRRDLFREASSRRGLSFDVIQKDFWVCFVLDRMFSHPEIGEGLHFKGGTSLSKCFNTIQRFSEDVDLTVGRAALGFDADYLIAAPTSSQKRKRRRSIRDAAYQYTSSTILPTLRDAIATVLGVGPSWRLSDSGEGVIRFLFPADPGLTAGTYLRPEVRLEIGGLSDLEPNERMPVRPYAAEEVSDAFSQPSTEVRVVLARRTLCDKLLLLHRLNADGADVPPEQSRHFYDVAMLARSSAREELLDFPRLLTHAIDYEGLAFPRTGVDYDELRPRDLRLSPSERQVPSLRRDYEAMVEMFSGEPPSVEDVLAEISGLEADLRALPPGPTD